jgi:hypothetical protein
MTPRSTAKLFIQYRWSDQYLRRLQSNDITCNVVGSKSHHWIQKNSYQYVISIDKRRLTKRALFFGIDQGFDRGTFLYYVMRLGRGVCLDRMTESYTRGYSFANPFDIIKYRARNSLKISEKSEKYVKIGPKRTFSPNRSEFSSFISNKDILTLENFRKSTFLVLFKEIFKKHDVCIGE